MRIRFGAKRKAGLLVDYIRSRESNKVKPIQNPRPNTEIATAGTQNKAIRMEAFLDRLAV